MESYKGRYLIRKIPLNTLTEEQIEAELAYHLEPRDGEYLREMIDVATYVNHMDAAASAYLVAVILVIKIQAPDDISELVE